MKWRDPNFVYHNAAESAKPGYLKRRFAAHRKAERQAEERRRQERQEAAGRVRPIKAA